MAGETAPAASRTGLLLAALASAVAFLAWATVAQTSGGPILLAGGDDAPGPARSLSDDAEHRLLDEPALAHTPSSRTGLAFLRLDDALEPALEVLGEPDERTPDINASTTYTWALPGDAQLSVTADELGIVGMYAHVPVGSPVELAAYGGVVPGTSTPADVAASWGDDHHVAEHEGDDFVLRYIECAGTAPIVVKFDQDGAAPEVRWDAPITSVLIAYADAEPGTAGCPST